MNSVAVSILHCKIQKKHCISFSPNIHFIHKIDTYKFTDAMNQLQISTYSGTGNYLPIHTHNSNTSKSTVKTVIGGRQLNSLQC